MGVLPSIIILPLYLCFALSILAWKQPGCPDNENVDLFYKTVATVPRDNAHNWLCDELFELKVNICSILFKTHIIPKFDVETMRMKKQDDTKVTEDCIPQRMRFIDEDGLDMRIDVRMFRCPVKFMVEDLKGLPPVDGETVYEFYITKGNTDYTVSLLLTSNDKTQKFTNLCLQDIFLYNDINGTSIKPEYIAEYEKIRNH